MIKQIVVVNMAVPMDFSQLTAQVAHASMLGILNQGEWNPSFDGREPDVFTIYCHGNPNLMTWLKDHFTLVVCKVWGKDKLLMLKSEAESLGINTAIMEDYGHTTALAIGPDTEERLITFKRLTLL